VAGAPPPALLGILRGVLLAVVLRDVLAHVEAARPAVRLVICVLSTSPYVDLAGAAMLTRLAGDLRARGAVLRLAEARASVRDVLRAEGLETVAGPISRHTSVAELIQGFEEAGVAAGGRATGNPT
jgi:anti-anti-sigma regulatory factor